MHDDRMHFRVDQHMHDVRMGYEMRSIMNDDVLMG